MAELIGDVQTLLDQLEALRASGAIECCLWKLCTVSEQTQGSEMQLSFGETEYAGKRKQTRRKKFLLEMARTIPWGYLAKRIQTHYPQQGKRGRPPYRLETLLRTHFMHV